MLAMFHLSFSELILIVAAFGIFVAIVSFAVSLIRPKHSPRRGLTFPILVAVVVGGVLTPLLGTRREGPQTEHRDYGEQDVLAPAIVEVKSAKVNSDPSLDALWDKLTKSRINLGGEATELAADPKDEVAKEAVKDSFGLDDEGKLPPKWVITPPKQVGQVYRASVASDPWATAEECRQQLVESLLPQAVAKRIEYLAPSRVRRKVTVADPLALGIGPDFILSDICRDEFTGTVDSSVGEMKKVHVLLEFDENIDNFLLDAWLRNERQTRLTSFGKIAALSLTGLAAIYGLLRFDTWSKGYYSRQLLVGGTLAIIALAVVLLQ
jgi:hypothetical protein